MKNHLVILFFTLSYLISAGMSQKTLWAQEPTSLDARFAIAIHGGAGGDPANWSAEEKTARQEGLKAALQIGVDMLKKGSSSLDVVEQVVISLEDNPVFNAGRGAILNAAGEHELDASIMDGLKHRCGAVASVTTIKNPISLARRVMEDTPHVMLIGSGAEQFADSINAATQTPEYFRTPAQIDRWKKWRDRQKENTQGVSAAETSADPLRYLGTVGCVVLDSAGNLAAATSTGGTLGKRWGRVGDSPIIGAGTYADNASCAVSCTGIGELFIRHHVAADIAARMKYGNATLNDAAQEVTHQVLPKDSGGLIAVSKDGEISMPFNTPGMSRGAADHTGRFEILLTPVEQ